MVLLPFDTQNNKEEIGNKTQTVDISLIVVLICRSTAYVWQSGRDAQFSADCGRMCWFSEILAKSPLRIDMLRARDLVLRCSLNGSMCKDAGLRRRIQAEQVGRPW
ncbi:hypothetical protein KCV07_g1040, partial [Aureobasidium melanogenum]